ncbi:hypothetical protein QBC35DRAFT_256763 [Podospora australis]|uniref:Uncharacterized protein n=1 Tax=Podospora australis TaxID=1536484 RepID=A0AAN6WR61_9PEZI|nr:hypothetical protein QBC35DRAFT_256763 [Podospora australis]
MLVKFATAERGVGSPSFLLRIDSTTSRSEGRSSGGRIRSPSDRGTGPKGFFGCLIRNRGVAGLQERQAHSLAVDGSAVLSAVIVSSRRGCLYPRWRKKTVKYGVVDGDAAECQTGVSKMKESDGVCRLGCPGQGKAEKRHWRGSTVCKGTLDFFSDHHRYRLPPTAVLARWGVHCPQVVWRRRVCSTLRHLLGPWHAFSKMPTGGKRRFMITSLEPVLC